ELRHPLRHGRREAEGDDHHVGLDHRLAALDRHRHAAATRIRLAQLRLDHAHAGDPVLLVGLDAQRLAVEQEAHAFLAGVGHLARRTGHGSLVAAVGTGDAAGAQADGAAHAVHAGVAAAQHHHTTAGQVGQLDVVFPAGDRTALRRGRIGAGDDASVLHQERQRRQHALGVLARQAAIGVAVGAGAEEHGVVFLEQLLHAHIAADLDAKPELDAHAFQHLAPAGDHRLVQLEGRDAELQQAANLLVAIVDNGLHAHARHAVRAGDAGRTGADHRHAVAGRLHRRQVRTPTLLEGGIDDVLLHRADGHRAEAVVERAAALAQAVLRTHAAAHLRQRIGRVAQVRGLADAVLLHQLQPLRDGVVHRALPAAVRVAAVQAAPGLVAGGLGAEAAIERAPVAGGAQLDRDAPRHLPRHLEELEDLLATHYAALRRLSASDSMLAALGLTSQNLPT